MMHLFLVCEEFSDLRASKLLMCLEIITVIRDLTTLGVLLTDGVAKGFYNCYYFDCSFNVIIVLTASVTICDCFLLASF